MKKLKINNPLRGKSEKLEVNEAENLKNQLARALADYDNLTKRVEREREELIKLASLGLVVRLLPILDQLEAAQKHLQDSGLAITIGQFKDTLKEEGITEIDARPGDEFSPELHEAVEVVEGERENTIKEVVLPGWQFADGQVIRHAKVKVVKP